MVYEFTFFIPTSEIFEEYHSESNHTIFIWIEDSFFKTSSNYTKTSEFVFNSPIVSVSTYNFSRFHKTTNKFINIEGSIEDSDCTGHISIFYKFDDYPYSELHSESMNTECIISFSNEVEFPTAFSESVHSITIYCSDEHNKKSNEEHIYFYYEYNSPELTINTFENGPYHRCLNKSIHLEGQIVDLDGTGLVTIRCYIDNDIIDTKTIEILNINEHPFSFDLEFPSELTESLHHLIVTATNESNKTSTPFRSAFQYFYNSPLLSITTRNNQTFVKDVNKKLYIDGFVQDSDERGTFTIKYKLDEETFNDLTTFYIYDNNQRPFTESIGIDSISCGFHSIYLYVVDDDNKTSSHQPLTFFVIPNSLKDNKHKNILSIPKTIYALTLTISKSSK